MNSSTSSSRTHAVAFALTLVIGVVSFLAGSEFLVRKAILSDSYEAYRARFRAADNTRVAIGDSRTAAAIAGPEVENLGLPGDDLQVVLEKLKARHSLKPLSHVVLQADPHQFAIYRLLKDSTGKLDDLVGQAPVLSLLRPYYRQYLMAHWHAALVRQFGGRVEAEQTAVKDLRDPGGSRWRELAVSRVQFHLPLENPEVTRVAAAYKATIRSLLSDGVKVCLVTYPVSTAYREASGRYASFAGAIEFYDRTAAETGASRANFWSALRDDDFGDTDHLSHQAAAAFTALLWKRCFEE